MSLGKFGVLTFRIKGGFMKFFHSIQFIRILAVLFALTTFFSNCSQEGYKTSQSTDPTNADNNNNDNANTDPFSDDQDNNPDALVFDVQAEDSLPTGLADNYHLKVMMDIATEDTNKPGATFLMMIFKAERYFCTSGCTDVLKWKKWSSSDSSTKWSNSGVRTKVGINSINEIGHQSVYEGNMNMIQYGGAELFAGYGIGSSELECANEMLNANRFKKVGAITVQAMKFLIGDPVLGGNITDLANYNLLGMIIPSMADYGSPGYYFVVGQSADGKTYYFKANRGDGSGQYDWVTGDLTEANLALHYTDMTTALSNKIMTIHQGPATDWVDVKVYIGYGVGMTAAAAAHDVLGNSKFNSTPFIVGK